MPKPKAAAAKSPVIDLRKELIDEYGRLKTEIALMDNKVARLKVLADTITAWADNDGIPADASKTYEGRQYAVEVTRRRKQTIIRNLPTLVKKVGVAKFIQHATITLENLKRLLTADEYDQAIVESFSGPRRIDSLMSLAAKEQRAA